MESGQEILKQKPEMDRSQDVQTVFTDMVQININNETVLIELGIISPHLGKAVVSHNIIMTIPHFIRFANVCQLSREQIERLMSDVQKNTKK